MFINNALQKFMRMNRGYFIFNEWLHLNERRWVHFGERHRDFMFQLEPQEVATLRCQFGTSNVNIGRGGRRYLPYAFTEQGVAMLSSVLRSPRAVKVNIEIMRAFVRIRQWLATNTELAHKLAEPEKKYDTQFKIVFDAIRELMRPPAPPKKRIGFNAD